MSGKYLLHPAGDAQFHWDLKAANAQTILSSQMYKAKAGHDGVLRYSPEAERNSGSLRAIAQLRFAIEHEPAQLVLHYQPKVNLLSGQLAGVEALVRWNHPERGFLMPGQFLSLAEKGRMMSALSDRVLQRALAELPTWHGELRGQTVAVNLPAAVGSGSA